PPPPTTSTDTQTQDQSSGQTQDQSQSTDQTQTQTQTVVTPVVDDVSSDPSDLAVLNGKLYFAATDAVNGRELWVSDGTADGTTLLKNINPEATADDGSAGPARDSNPTGLTRVGSAIFFAADNGRAGVELWRTDGTEAGTTKVRNINALQDP